MESLIIAFEVVFPLLIFISLGYFLKSIKLMEEPLSRSLNNLVFKVFLPIMLFYNLLNSDLGQSFDVQLLTIALCGIFGTFLLGIIIVPIFVKDRSKIGVMVQGMFRTNVALFGIPIVSAISGDAGVGKISLLIAIGVPLFNVLAVIALEMFKDEKINIKRMAKNIATNTIIISCVVGLIANLASLQLPDILMSVIEDVSGMTTPISLISLGASLTFGSFRSMLPHLSAVVIVRLIICPLIMISIGIMLGLRGPTLAALTAYSAAPTAISAYTMVQVLGGDSVLAGRIVVFTSALSIVTVFVFVFTISQLGYF